MMKDTVEKVKQIMKACNVACGADDARTDGAKEIIDLIESEGEKNSSGIVCPFCLDDDFDKEGFKYHLIHYCKIYNELDVSNW